MHGHKNKNNRVAWLITTMGYGDSLLYWEPIIKGYLERLPNTLIFTSGTKRSSGGADIPIKNAVRMHRFNLPWLKGTYPRSLILIRPGIISDILRYRPKVLILSEFGLLTAYGMVASALMPNTKVLLLVESDPRPVSGTKSYMRTLLRRVMCSASTKILTNNKSGQDYLMNELHVPQSKIFVGPYLVSQPHITEVKNQSASNSINEFPIELNDRVIFLFVGQLIERKGLQYLIEAASQLPSEYKDRFEIWIVGDGNARDDLQKQINAATMEQQVRLIGRVPYTDLHQYYARADVFVLPTLADYRGLVGFEALSYGLAMLHSRLDGAASEVVQQGINGFMFDPRDISELRDHIKWYLDNPEKLKDFAQHSKQLSEKYTVENAVSVLSTAIERTVNA